MADRIEKKALNEILHSHPICAVQRVLRKYQIIDAFRDYVDADSFAKWHLCLYRFATTKPLSFTEPTVVNEALAFFERQPTSTMDGLTALKRELSHAIFTALRPGASWGREGKVSLEGPDEMAEFESIWHPEYQRYCEHVFNHLTRLPLHVIGGSRGKDYLAPTLANRVELMRKNNLAALTAGYDSVVRNAISHGSSSFESTGVRYSDQKNDRLLAGWEFADLFDGLVDTCHSIIVALLLFLCRNQSLVEEAGLHRLPLGLRFIFVDAWSSHRGLQLLSMIETNTASPKKQLNVVCRINSRARWAQLFEAMHTCWNASVFGGRDYSRYFVGFDCGMPVLTSVILDGANLLRAIEGNEALDTCGPGMIEASLLWYDTSGLGRRLYSWKCWLPIQWQIAKRDFIDGRRRAGLKVLGSRYDTVEVLNRSTEHVRQVEAHIVLRGEGAGADELLEGVVRHAIGKLRKHKVRRTDLYGEKGRAGKPDYIRLRLYARQRRARTLMSYGWKDKDLLLIAEWISSASKTQPFYTQQADVVLGRIRIKYNPGRRRTLKPENGS